MNQTIKNVIVARRSLNLLDRLRIYTNFKPLNEIDFTDLTSFAMSKQISKDDLDQLTKTLNNFIENK